MLQGPPAAYCTLCQCKPHSDSHIDLLAVADYRLVTVHCSLKTTARIDMEGFIDVEPPKVRKQIRRDLSLSWMKRALDGSQHPALTTTDPQVVFCVEKDRFERIEGQQADGNVASVRAEDPPTQTQDDDHM